MRQFETWSDVARFMRRGTSRDAVKNEVLGLILRSHAADHDPVWRLVLLVIFWPGLMSLHHKKRHWDPLEPDELMQRIFFAFLQSVCRIDVTRRGDHIAQRLYCGTMHRAYQSYERTWRHAKRELAMAPDELEEFGDAGVPDLDGAIDLLEERRRELDRLQKYRDTGRISEVECMLGVGCLVYHRLVAAHARATGLGYEVAKKRLQRLRVKIKQLDETTR